MAELEQEEVIDEVVETPYNEEAPEIQEEEPETITWEQAQEWKAKAERLDEAEKKIVDQKRKLKEKEKQEQNDTSTLSKEDMEKYLDERDKQNDFYRENPDAKNYKDKIELYLKRGNSLEESYLLASKSDKEIDEKREVYGKSIVRGNQSSTEGIKIVDLDTFDRMTSDEQNKYTSDTKSKF